MLDDDLGRELLDHLAVLLQRLDKARAHHLAVVGNGVVEREGRDGRYLCFVANRHPGQGGLAPVEGAVGGLVVRHANARLGIAHDGQLQVGGQTGLVDALDKLLGMAAEVLVDDARHADVRAHLEGARQRDGAVAALAPVVVLHVAAVHVPHAAARVDPLRGVADAGVESHEYAGRLEHGARLAQVRDGVVLNLAIFAVGTARHVDDGLHVARLHFHEDGHAQVAADELQLVDDGTLGQVLHGNVDGGHDVIAVDGGFVDNLHAAVEHLLHVYDAVFAAQERVERQFQSAACRVDGAKHVAYGALSQRAEGASAGVERVVVEAALILAESEDRQFVHFAELVVGDAVGPDGPVAQRVLAGLLYVVAELLGRLGEDGGQSFADGVHLHAEQRVFLEAAGLEVHVNLILRYARSHELSVATENVATVRGDGVVDALLACGHLLPVVFLGRHGVEGLAHHGNAR